MSWQHTWAAGFCGMILASIIVVGAAELVYRIFRKKK